MQSSCHDSVVISFNVDWKEFKSTSNYFSPPVFIKKKKKKEKNRKPGIMLKQTSCGLSVDRTGSIFYRYLRKELRQNNSELFTSKISKVIESIVNVGRVFSVSSYGFGNSVCFAFSFEVFGFP